MNSINISTRSIQAKVVGVSFEGRQTVVAQLREGEKVLLVRDPHNPYDRNAVKVVLQNGQQFGFLDRYLAATISPQLDHYGSPVSELMGGFYPGSNLGVLVQFELPE